MSTNSAMLSLKLNFLSHNCSKLLELNNSFTNRGHFLKMIVLSTKNPCVIFKTKHFVPHNSIPSSQIWKIPSQMGGHFFNMIIVSTNSAMLSSKLKILSHISIPSCQSWNILSQIGSFFSDNHFEHQKPYVIFKLNVLSHNSGPSSQIWKIPSQTEVIFLRLSFWVQQPYIIFKIEHFIPHFCLS